MVKNYSKEARISKIYADSIVGRAVFVSLLYMFGIILVANFVDFVILFSLDIFFSIDIFEAWPKWVEPIPVLRDYSLDFVIIIKEIITGVSSFLFSLISLLVKIYSEPNYFKKARARYKAQIKAAKKRRKTARKKRDKVAVRKENRTIAEYERKIYRLKTLLKMNRYAKNEFTATKFRRAKQVMISRQKRFSKTLISMFLFMFAYAIYYMSQLDSNTPVTVIFEEEYTMHLLVLMAGGLAFHFLGGIIAGSIPYIRLRDHENTYIHMDSYNFADIESMNFDGFPLEVEQTDVIRASFPRRWDDSSAILEEQPRDYGVWTFFLRNVVQIVFTLAFAVLYLYMYPALHKITEIGVAEPFGLIFTILKWLMAVFLGIFMIYAFSSNEYGYECMDEALRSWRRGHTAFVILFLCMVGAYFALVMIAGVKDAFLSYYEPIFIEEAQVQFEGTFDYSYALQMGSKWAKEYVDDINARIIVCLSAGIVFSLAMILSNLVIIPRDRIKLKDEDFFAFSSRHKDIPKEIYGEGIR